MSPAGEVALAAERGQIAPVPIGLINGNTHRQGTRPPFSPPAVTNAVRQVLARPRLTSRQITDLVGPPDFITGCTVTGNVAALVAGQRTEWHARHPELEALTGLPIKEFMDLTTCGDYWYACLPADGTHPEELRDQLLKVYGVTIYVPVGLPRPLPAMIRAWTRACQDEDPQASLTALEGALASRLQRRLMSY